MHLDRGLAGIVARDLRARLRLGDVGLRAFVLDLQPDRLRLRCPLTATSRKSPRIYARAAAAA